MKTIQELNAEYKSLITEGEALLADGKLQEAQAKLSKSDEVMAQIEVQKKFDAGRAYLGEPAGTQAAHFRPAAPEEGNMPVDAKSFRTFEVGIITPRGVEKKEFRYNVPLAVQKKGYSGAFESYVRRGMAEVGPNDRKALTEAVDSAGGITVPEDIQSNILKKVATMATVRLYARVIQTSRDLAHWTRIKYTTNNEYTSGVRLTWTGETPSSATVHRVTDQSFGSVSIPIHTAMASQLVSNDLIEDSAYDVMGISADLFGEAFALGENDVFWTGTGAGQPRGIITDASDTTNWDAAVIAADAVNDIIAQDVIDVCYALPSQYERNARWFFTKTTEKKIRSMTDTNGTYLWPVWGQVGQFGPNPSELLGFPYTRDEFMQEISSEGVPDQYPLVFGDLSGYVIADRVGLSVQRNDVLYAETNNTLLLGRKRVGGQLAEAYRLSLLHTSTSS